MTFDEYQRAAAKTAVYPRHQAMVYLTLGLAGEAGEAANKVKKLVRGDGQATRADVAAELGDVLWYLSELAHWCGYTLDDIAQRNIAKLTDRAERGAIKGAGDTR